jgi:hypothetical protein
MTKMQAARARKVVDHFRQVLPPQACAEIGDEHFDELALMIESAIEAAVFDELTGCAARLEGIIAEWRRDALTFDEMSALRDKLPRR